MRSIGQGQTDSSIHRSGSRFSLLFRVATVLIVLLTVVSGRALAQNSTANILGMVTDLSGATVPDVTVTMTNLGNGDMKSYVTNQTGAYLFTNLLPGRYSIAMTGGGFQTVKVPERSRLSQVIVDAPPVLAKRTANHESSLKPQ